VLREEAHSEVPKFGDWSEFRRTFIEEFCPKHETRLAVTRLETTEYYQRQRSVDDYLDEFRELVEQAGYKEGLAIVMKFRRGLNREIQDQIAQLAIGRPKDDAPEEWYHAAVTADENRTTNLMFHGGTRTPAVRLPPGQFPTPRRSLPIQGPRPFNSAPLRRTTPVTTGSTIVNKERSDACRRCGQPGHWAQDCGRRFDIRHMTADERDEWLQNLSLQADVTEIETRDAQAETEAEGEERSGAEKEDFSECSG
jgi:Retrotransposon gag protein/Zinc knuckle